MDPEAIVQYISETFEGLNVADANGDTFFIYDPKRDLPPSRQMPFATLVTSDRYDSFSDLERKGVFRLNVGVSDATFGSLVADETTPDYTALDRIMPHPVYGQMHWLCVLNPSPATWVTVRALLSEAYDRVVDRYRRMPQQAEA